MTGLNSVETGWKRIWMYALRFLSYLSSSYSKLFVVADDKVSLFFPHSAPPPSSNNHLNVNAYHIISCFVPLAANLPPPPSNLIITDMVQRNWQATFLAVPFDERFLSSILHQWAHIQ